MDVELPIRNSLTTAVEVESASRQVRLWLLGDIAVLALKARWKSKVFSVNIRSCIRGLDTLGKDRSIPQLIRYYSRGVGIVASCLGMVLGSRLTVLKSP